MPQIDIRPAESADIPILIALDHNYSSDFVWQMDVVIDEGQMGVNFRQVKLPRSVRVEYPRPPKLLAGDWESRAGLLVANLENEVVGYISLSDRINPDSAWVTDLVVVRRLRRQGIGTTLILAGQEWAREHHTYRMIMEMQPKNFAAYSLAQKLGYDFCGYNDRFYANRDIGLFFGKSLR
jgi:ribosomal protein S18 acetylase RimI-like enzyme